MKKNKFFLEVKKNIYYFIEEKKSLNDIGRNIIRRFFMVT
jgi:hypothetical protein